MKKAVLILNGALNLEFICTRLTGVSDTYCTDGAYNLLSQSSLALKAVLGDMDSLCVPMKDGIQKIVLEDQNFTDFHKTLDYLKNHYTHVDVYGAGGGSWDHFLGNLYVAKQFKVQLALTFIEPDQTCFLMRHTVVLQDVLGKTISLIPFPEAMGVSSKGLQYELNAHHFQLGGAMSIRNRACHKNVSINCKSGDLLVCIS